MSGHGDRQDVTRKHHGCGAVGTTQPMFTVTTSEVAVSIFTSPAYTAR